MIAAVFQLAVGPLSQTAVDSILKAVYRAGYKDYCEWDRNLRTLHIGPLEEQYGPKPNARYSLTAAALGALDREFRPQALATTERSFELQGHGALDRRSSYLMSGLLERFGGTASVCFNYQKKGGYMLSRRYDLRRSGTAWKVVGSGMPYDADSRVLTGASGSHSYRVEIRQRPFDLRAHRLSVSTDGGYLVDGSRAWGTDGWVPRSEISSLRVWVDEKPWVIPSRLWRGCYQVHLREQTEFPLLFVWLSKDGRRLTIKALCSDGAGGYRLYWRLRKGGRHKVDFEAGDC